MKESTAQLIKSYESGRSTGTLRRLGEFLSTPIDSGYTPDFSSTPDVGGIADAGNVVVSALNILFTILKFIFKL